MNQLLGGIDSIILVLQIILAALVALFLVLAAGKFFIAGARGFEDFKFNFIAIIAGSAIIALAQVISNGINGLW